MLSIIQTQAAPAAIGPYSQGIVSGDTVFVSGQLGIDPRTGALKSQDFDGQAHQALVNLESVLKAAGCALDQVAAVDVFLTDMNDFAAFNAIYEAFLGSHKPARAVVAVKALPKNAVIEIKCIASRKQ